MKYSNQPLELDEALATLRSSGSTGSESFSQHLEERLMAEQRRFAGGGRRPIAMPILLAFGALMVAGGAVSYAAINGWLPRVFSIDAEGVVTNESGDVVGETIEHEDGTSTTIVRQGDQIEYRVDSDVPLNGRELKVWSVPKNGQ